MSYLNEEGFNLFTMQGYGNEKETFTVPEMSKNATKTVFATTYEETDVTGTLWFNLEPIKKETVYSNTLNELKWDMSNIRNRSMAKYLRSLKVGETIYLAGFRGTYRVDIKEINDKRYKASYYLYDQFKKQYIAVEDMDRFDNYQWRVRDVIAKEHKGEIHYFTLNPEESFKLVPQRVFLEYMENVYNDIGLQTLAVYYAYFGMNHIDDGKLVTKNVVAAFKKSGDICYLRNVETDYWEQPFELDKSYKDTFFEFNFLGKKAKIDQNTVDKTFNEIINTLSLASPTDLSNLNDLELLIYYKIQGYVVNVNLTTYEWFVRKNHSEQAFLVNRLVLNNFIEMVELLRGKLNKHKKVAKVMQRNEALAKSYIETNFTLKPFVIPTGVTVILPEKVKALAEPGEYQVLTDDGKYVTLKKVDSEEQKKLQIPRKDITKIKARVTDFGLQPIKGETDLFLSIPYGIPSEQESTIEQLCKNYVGFLHSLPEDEYYKYLVLDGTITDRKVNQALQEQKLEEVAAFFSNQWNYRVSSQYIAKKTNATVDFMVYDAKDCNVPGMLGRKPLNFINFENDRNANRLVTGIREDGELQKNVAFQVYLSMYEAVMTLPATELTIVELMFAYRLADMRLDYHGPTHFELNGECVHTSKYDLFNIEETKRKVFFE